MDKLKIDSKTDRIESQDIEAKVLLYLNGMLDEADAELIENRIATDSNFRKMVGDISRINLMGTSAGNIDIETAIDNTHKRIRNNRFKAIWNITQKVAAVLILPLVFTLTFLSVKYFGGSTEAEMMELTTTPGMMSHATLPDGSEVWLNSGSTLRYPSGFKKAEREVILEGEGYFKVTKQNGRRFVVNSNGVKITVLGTEFNVESYSDRSNEVRTTLVNGRINLSYQDLSGNTHEAEVVPGERYTYNNVSGKISKENINTATAASWKDGKIVLDNTSISDALRLIGNRFNVEFIVKNRELLSNHYTGVFTKQNLDTILEILRQTTDISFETLEPDTDGMERIVVY